MEISFVLLLPETWTFEVNSENLPDSIEVMVHLKCMGWRDDTLGQSYGLIIR